MEDVEQLHIVLGTSPYEGKEGKVGLGGREKGKGGGDVYIYLDQRKEKEKETYTSRP